MGWERSVFDILPRSRALRHDFHFLLGERPRFTINTCSWLAFFLVWSTLSLGTITAWLWILSVTILQNYASSRCDPFGNPPAVPNHPACLLSLNWALFWGHLHYCKITFLKIWWKSGKNLVKIWKLKKPWNYQGKKKKKPKLLLKKYYSV